MAPPAERDRRHALPRWQKGLAYLLAAAALASCSAGAGHGTGPSSTSGTSGSTNADGPTTSSRPTVPKTTTTTLPPSFRVGLLAFHFVEPAAKILDPVTGETLVGRHIETEVYYPTLVRGSAGVVAGAQPARGGPFPVVVFAHGFETMPSDYAPLIDAWVSAGFVVVAPVFPDENELTVSKDGGLTDALVATRAESDLVNEPADISFVTQRLAALSAPGSGSELAGVLDLRKLALAGQSDGADAVAALSYDSAYSASLAALPSTPGAVAVLSGAELAIAGQDYGATAASPPLLMVQSDADECNYPQSALQLYEALSGDGSSGFIELLGADHLGPYVDAPGAQAYAAVVKKATTLFFELHLGWRDRSLRPADLALASDVEGVSRFSTMAPQIPSYNGGHVCPPPPEG